MNSKFLIETQYDNIKVNNPENKINKILRFENIEKDFSELRDILKIKINYLKYYSNHKDYKLYYDEKIKIISFY